MNSSQLQDFARRYTVAWCSQDPAQVANFFSPTGSLQVNAAPPAIGRTAITAVAQGFMTAFPDLHLTMNKLLIEHTRAIYHWTFAGTNSAPGGTGHRVLFSGHEVWHFSPDGLIAESQGHFDESLYNHQLQHGLDAP